MAAGKPFDSARGRAAAQRSHEEREARALAAREHFLGVIAGAKVRVTHLPRELISTTAFAVANKMLMDILVGEYQINSARDAATVAKLALDIARLEFGDPSSNLGELSREERALRVKAITELRERLLGRADEHEAAEAEHREAESNADGGDSTPRSAPLAAVRPIVRPTAEEE